MLDFINFSSSITAKKKQEREKIKENKGSGKNISKRNWCGLNLCDSKSTLCHFNVKFPCIHTHILIIVWNMSAVETDIVTRSEIKILKHQVEPDNISNQCLLIKSNKICVTLRCRTFREPPHFFINRDGVLLLPSLTDVTILQIPDYTFAKNFTAKTTTKACLLLMRYEQLCALEHKTFITSLLQISPAS